ncbi:MAG: 4Fe-4S binding protein [Methylohalobius sp.]|nr:4Fe-4S binding protein [Methylohalobius sp.]
MVHENTQADVVKAFCEQQGDKILLLAVEALGAVGPDAWLAALAYGASAVWLLANGILNHTRSNLQAQMQWVRAILAALGYNPQAVRWVHVDQGNIEWLAQPGIPSAAFWPLADKREVLRLALFHLTCHASFKPAEIPLPEGSPLGAIEVDSGSCTLCMACAYVCPVKALRVEGDKPQLKFVEINCVQCGLCKHACPEKAIRLKPRFLTDWDELRQARILHEEVPFNCLGCGRPFATAKMIGVILARMSTHSMFAFEHQRRRLMLCEECRIRDITMAEDNGD